MAAYILCVTYNLDRCKLPHKQETEGQQKKTWGHCSSERRHILQTVQTEGWFCQYVLPMQRTVRASVAKLIERRGEGLVLLISTVIGQKEEAAGRKDGVDLLKVTGTHLDGLCPLVIWYDVFVSDKYSGERQQLFRDLLSHLNRYFPRPLSLEPFYKFNIRQAVFKETSLIPTPDCGGPHWALQCTAERKAVWRVDGSDVRQCRPTLGERWVSMCFILLLTLIKALSAAVSTVCGVLTPLLCRKHVGGRMPFNEWIHHLITWITVVSFEHWEWLWS